MGNVAVTMALGLAGGLGVFLVGLNFLARGMQRWGLTGFRKLTGILTAHPVTSLAVGVLGTVLFQSSSACTTLAMSFISAGMIDLAQGLGIMLGSAVGTSLTAHLIAFRLSDYSLALVAVGAAGFILGKPGKVRNTGQVVLGLGLIFLGMGIVSGAAAHVPGLPAVAAAFSKIGSHTLLAFLLALLVTSVLQSSTATLALLMSLVSEGALGYSVIVPGVLGAHLGGTVTAAISAYSMKHPDALRASLGNVAFKAAAALVMLPLSGSISAFLFGGPGAIDVRRAIANAHMLGSLAMAGGFLPLLKTAASLLYKWLPGKEEPLSWDFLDSALSVPSVSLQQIRKELVRLGSAIDEEMLSNILPALQGCTCDVLDRIAAAEERADLTHRNVQRYLTAFSSSDPSEEEALEAVRLLYVSNDLEHVGDAVLSICQIAEKIQEMDIQFAPSGWHDIDTMRERVARNFRTVMEALDRDDFELAVKVLKAHPETMRLEKDLRLSQFSRLQTLSGQRSDASSAYFDLIDCLRRIDDHSVSIAQAILGIV